MNQNITVGTATIVWSDHNQGWMDQSKFVKGHTYAANKEKRIIKDKAKAKALVTKWDAINARSIELRGQLGSFTVPSGALV
jgi:hypothetical protein